MNVTRSEDVQDVFWTCYTRSIYVLCPGGNKYFVRVKFPCDHSWEIILGYRVALACIVIVPAFLVLRKWLLKFLITNCFMFLENNTYLTERLLMKKLSKTHILFKEPKIALIRSSPSEVFLRKGVLKICSKFTKERPCRVIQIYVMHIFRIPFLRTALDGCFCLIK